MKTLRPHYVSALRYALVSSLSRVLCGADLLLLVPCRFSITPPVCNLRNGCCSSDKTDLLLVSTQQYERREASLQNGLVSSHFFFLFRQVVHPVFDRALVAFDEAVGERGGYNLGRPRPRLARTGSVGDMGGSVPAGSALTSASCSSCSSILGMISSEPSRESIRGSVCVSGR